MSPSGAPIPVVPSRAGRELVLVLPRSVALAQGSWHGLRVGGVRELLDAIPRFGEFRPRAEVESSPQWQQLIPHLVVRADDRVLAMRRLGAGSERRLRGQVTIGVGGHINSGDGDLEHAWLGGLRREWDEEVACDRGLTGWAVGLMKDDAGAVGQVHLGVLILVDAGGARVEVKERTKLEGRMTPLRELGVLYLEMETWSQFAYDAILAGAVESGVGDSLEIDLPGSERPKEHW